MIQYIASSQINYEKDIPVKLLLLMEEPETYLHPEAQRALAKSIKTIAHDPDYQTFITSHSPSVISEVPLESIYLTKYSNDGCVISRDVDYFAIAEELGIRPSDALVGYDLCIFVEGYSDMVIFTHILKNFSKGKISEKMLEKIGIIPTGGSNIHSLVSYKLLHKINKNFLIILDSDKTSKEDDLKPNKVLAKQYAEQFGGTCFILRKREIENYIHPEAIIRILKDYPDLRIHVDEIRAFEDFTDVKKFFQNKFKIKPNHITKLAIKLFANMSIGEFNKFRNISTRKEKKCWR